MREVTMKMKTLVVLAVLVMLVFSSALTVADSVHFGSGITNAGLYADEPNMPEEPQDPNDPNVPVPE